MWPWGWEGHPLILKAECKGESAEIGSPGHVTLAASPDTAPSFPGERAWTPSPRRPPPQAGLALHPVLTCVASGIVHLTT